MAANTFYISAGLPVAKNSGQSPTAGVNTAYVSAGLPAAPIFSSTSTSSIGSITSYSRSNVTNLYNQIGGKGVRRRSFSQRPDTFTIDPTHYLARGLVFAGLGPGDLRGSTHYHDSSLYGNHGTLVDGATWIFDPVLGRFVLNLTAQGQHVAAPSVNLGAGDFSISAWVNRNASSGFRASIVSQGDTSAGEWMTRAHSTGSRFDLYGDGGSIYSSGENAWVADTWCHFACVRKGETTAVWSNGVYGGQDTSSGADLNTEKPLQIGGADSASTRWFVGKLSDIMIWRGVAIGDPLEQSPLISQLADPSNTILSGLIRHPKRTIFKSAVSNFPTTQYTRLSLCALPTRPYKTFIAKTQYTPPIIVLTRHFTPLQLFQNTI